MDKKKKNINQPKNNTYWMYGLIISIFIIFSYIGNGDNFSTTKQINISTFEKYLNASEVSKVTIINKTLAEVTLTENALLNEIHRDVSKTNLIGQRNTLGPHYTFEVGDVSNDVKKLLLSTKESLYAGIREFKSGNRVGDISYAIQKFNEDNGYGVVKDLVGHGLGEDLHEKPEVPNFGKRGNGKKLVDGMVLAIEPMINMGTEKVEYLKDGWTILTADRKPSAHFEHDVAMIDGKPKLLSTFKYIYESLGIDSQEESEFL